MLGEGTIFVDQVDLGAGRSWVTHLQRGLDQAESVILVVTPEAMASPRVQDEYESLIAARPESCPRTRPADIGRHRRAEVPVLACWVMRTEPGLGVGQSIDDADRARMPIAMDLDRGCADLVG